MTSFFGTAGFTPPANSVVCTLIYVETKYSQHTFCSGQCARSSCSADSFCAVSQNAGGAKFSNTLLSSPPRWRSPVHAPVYIICNLISVISASSGALVSLGSMACGSFDDATQKAQSATYLGSMNPHYVFGPFVVNLHAPARTILA